MRAFPKRPPPFLSVRVEESEADVPLLGLCAGYERGLWRRKALGRYLFRHLLEFSFRWSELDELESKTAYEMLAEAAKRLYASERYRGRGEFGELLLHAVLRSHFSSEPALSKIFFKSADNETVKGYDCVHVVPGREGGLELWFGEAKLYSYAGKAIRDALEELKRHTATKYLRREFALIQGKIEGPYAEQIKEMLDQDRSLDEVFDVLRIPVLLTYNSKVLKDHDRVSPEYKAAIEVEIRKHYERFVKGCADLPGDVHVHVILVPLNTRRTLVDHLDKRLRELQAEDDEETEDDEQRPDGDGQ